MSERRNGPQPEILSVRTAARSRLFHIEAVKLRFSNGNEREYERLAGSAEPGAVVIVPLLDARNILLVREYAVGLERYELGLPMGLIHGSESTLEAANRELMEETGYAAHKLTHLHTLALAPGILGYRMDVVLATDLHPRRLQGDEPEPLETVLWPIDRLDELSVNSTISDARTLAALFVARGAVTAACRT
jgi:ADP-ribose diphosphatase